MASFLNQAARFLFGSISAKGWNYDKIKWHDLDEGRQACIDKKMPAMIVIHRTKCPACMALKPKFKNNKDIEKLSKEFIMINVEDEKENKLKEFQADGDYVPRILFMDVDGKVLRHVKNDKSHYGKYFHAETGSIVQNMKYAMVAARREGVRIQHLAGGARFAQLTSPRIIFARREDFEDGQGIP